MILIVDFGSQTAHLIGRRLRQIGAKTEYTNPEDAFALAKKLKPNGIIFSGGPNNISEDASLSIEPEILQLGIPVLGICYGWQLIAHLLGGEIRHSKKEYGPEEVTFDTQPSIFNVNSKRFSAIMSHGDSVTKLPKDFVAVGKTKQVAYAAVLNEDKKIFGVQFHLEANHTEHGMDILKNFAEVCEEKLEPVTLDPEKIIADIKALVGDQKVICAVSGGVDSTVAATLIHRAIGENLYGIFVDNGVLRKNEFESVLATYAKLGLNVKGVDARQRFYNELAGKTDPEAKRKTIGRLFIDIFQEEAAHIPGVSFLGQGTIYPDVIESVRPITSE